MTRNWMCLAAIWSIFSLLISLVNSAPSLHIDSLLRASATEDDKLLHIAVYYESKCWDSKKFINEQVSKAIELVPELFKLYLIPFGNANYKWNNKSKMWDYQCQHGPDECYGNIIHNCLMFYRPNFVDYFPFINCSMENLLDMRQDVAIYCNHLHAIPWEAVHECADSKMGNQLMFSSAILTYRLSPKKSYVPWIVVNSVHTDQIQKEAEFDLVGFICREYKGTKVVEACSNSFNVTKTIEDDETEPDENDVTKLDDDEIETEPDVKNNDHSTPATKVKDSIPKENEPEQNSTITTSTSVAPKKNLYF